MPGRRAKLSAGAGVLLLAVSAGRATHAAQGGAALSASAQSAPTSLQDFAQRLTHLRTAVWRVYAATDALGTDARGRTLAQDLDEWVMGDAVRARLRDLEARAGVHEQAGDAQGGQAALQSARALLADQVRRLALISSYWLHKPNVDRQRELWQRWRQQVPDTDAQASAARVQPFEARLRQDFSPALSVEDLQRDIAALEAAYNSERLQLAASVSERRLAAGGVPLARERRTPCSQTPSTDAPLAAGPAATGSNDGATSGAASGPPLNAGAVQPARLLSSLAPTLFYPLEARRSSISGRVVVRLLIGVDGCVDQTRIERSSGAPALDQAAMDFAEYMRFAPARRDGRAVPMAVRLPVNFQLQGEPTAPAGVAAGTAAGSLSRSPTHGNAGG